MRHKQYYTSEAEPTVLVCVVSSEEVKLTLNGFVSITARQFRKLRWSQRKARILDRKDRFKERASKVKKAFSE